MQKDVGTSISKYTQEDVKSLKRERKMGIYHINIYTGFGMCVCRLVHVNAKNKTKKKTKRIYIQRERGFCFLRSFAACGQRPRFFFFLPFLLTYGLENFSLFLSLLFCHCVLGTPTAHSRQKWKKDRSGFSFGSKKKIKINNDTFEQSQKKKIKIIKQRKSLSQDGFFVRVLLLLPFFFFLSYSG